MIKRNNSIRGIVDPISIIGALFLVVTLIIGAVVVKDKKFSLNINEKAASSKSAKDTLNTSVRQPVAAPEPDTSDSSDGNTKSYCGYCNGSTCVACGADSSNMGECSSNSQCGAGSVNIPPPVVQTQTTTPVDNNLETAEVGYIQQVITAPVVINGTVVSPATSKPVVNEPEVVTPVVPVVVPTPVVQQKTCSADGAQYPENSVVVYAGQGSYRKCVGGSWVNNCGEADGTIKLCEITDLTPNFVPTYLGGQYQAAIEAQKQLLNPVTETYVAGPEMQTANTVNQTTKPALTEAQTRDKSQCLVEGGSWLANNTCSYQQQNNAIATLSKPPASNTNKYNSREQCLAAENNNPYICNKYDAAASLYTGLNTLTSGKFGDYVEAFQEPHFTWQTAGFSSSDEYIKDCVAKNGILAAYSCTKQSSALSAEAVTSSIKLGTDITGKAAAVAALPEVLTAGSFSGALGTAFKSLSAINTAMGTPNTVATCISGSGQDCVKQTIQTGINWIFLGSMDAMSTATSTMNGAQAVNAVKQTAIVNGAQIGVNAINTFDACSGGLDLNCGVNIIGDVMLGYGVYQNGVMAVNLQNSLNNFLATQNANAVSQNLPELTSGQTSLNMADDIIDAQVGNIDDIWDEALGRFVSPISNETALALTSNQIPQLTARAIVEQPNLASLTNVFFNSSQLPVALSVTNLNANAIGGGNALNSISPTSNSYSAGGVSGISSEPNPVNLQSNGTANNTQTTGPLVFEQDNWKLAPDMASVDPNIRIIFNGDVFTANSIPEAEEIATRLTGMPTTIPPEAGIIEPALLQIDPRYAGIPPLPAGFGTPSVPNPNSIYYRENYPAGPIATTDSVHIKTDYPATIISSNMRNAGRISRRDVANAVLAAVGINNINSQLVAAAKNVVERYAPNIPITPDFLSYGDLPILNLNSDNYYSDLEIDEIIKRLVQTSPENYITAIDGITIIPSDSQYTVKLDDLKDVEIPHLSIIIDENGDHFLFVLEDIGNNKVDWTKIPIYENIDTGEFFIDQIIYKLNGPVVQTPKDSPSAITSWLEKIKQQIEDLLPSVFVGGSPAVNPDALTPPSVIKLFDEPVAISDNLPNQISTKVLALNIPEQLESPYTQIATLEVKTPNDLYDLATVNDRTKKIMLNRAKQDGNDIGIWNAVTGIDQIEVTRSLPPDGRLQRLIKYFTGKPIIGDTPALIYRVKIDENSLGLDGPTVKTTVDIVNPASFAKIEYTNEISVTNEDSTDFGGDSPAGDAGSGNSGPKISQQGSFYVPFGIAAILPIGFYYADQYLFDGKITNYVTDLYNQTKDYLLGANKQSNNLSKKDIATSQNIPEQQGANNVMKYFEDPVDTGNVNPTTPPDGLTKTGEGKCQRIDTSNPCDGDRIYQTYLEYQKYFGNISPAEFLAMILMAEANGADSDFLKSITLATSSQLWGNSSQHKAYCKTPNCTEGIFNFIGAYMEAGTRRYNTLLYEKDPEKISNLIKADIAAIEYFNKNGLSITQLANDTIYNPVSTTYSNDTPTQWGNFGCSENCDYLGPNWIKEANQKDIQTGTTDVCGLYDVVGQGDSLGVVFTENQKYNWSIKNPKCFPK